MQINHWGKEEGKKRTFQLRTLHYHAPLYLAHRADPLVLRLPATSQLLTPPKETLLAAGAKKQVLC